MDKDDIMAESESKREADIIAKKKHQKAKLEEYEKKVEKRKKDHSWQRKDIAIIIIILVIISITLGLFTVGMWAN